MDVRKGMTNCSVLVISEIASTLKLCHFMNFQKEFHTIYFRYTVFSNCNHNVDGL